MKIDFLLADNRYGSTRHFAKGFCAALERAGVEVRKHWIDDGQFYHAYSTITQDPPDCTCSFADLTFGTQSLGNSWQIPHFSYLIDPAIYFLHHFQGDYSWVSCVDQGDVDFVKQGGFSKVQFLPHGVDRDLETSPFVERPYEVVFFGSCLDTELDWSERFSKNECDLLHQASEAVLQTPISTLDALVELGVSQEKLLFFHHEVDLYTRAKDRIALLQSLKGVDISIWGTGSWNKYLPNAKIYTPIPFEETLDVMRRAKFVLNSSVRFKNGFHERLFYGLMCGACVVSSESRLMREHFAEDELLTYTTPEEVLGKMHGCIPNEIALKGQKRVLKEHTWDHRAKRFLEFIHDF